ncbi:MAG: hypothetical protein RLZZ223_282 [Candidatus Parcubacteria bacterium]|jgi:hypothetical protein
MNWQKDKLTIIGFGIIFVILAVFGYLLWDMNREPMAEVVTESTPPETIVPETPASEEQELPDYPITKVDTTGWEYRETKLGDVGIRYKVMNQNLDNRVGDDKFLDPHFDLEEFGIKGLIIAADNKDRLGKGYDIIDITNCVNCGGEPYEPAPGRIDIDIVENPELNLSDIKNLLLSETCSYTIVEDPLNEMSPYTLDEKCSADEQFISYSFSSKAREFQKIGDILNLRVSGKEISQYKNPFINTDKASQLIKYPIAISALNISEINFDDQILFIMDLGNDKFAIITQSNARFQYAPGAYKEDDSKYNERANNLMHTILSTIEVL